MKPMSMKDLGPRVEHIPAERVGQGFRISMTADMGIHFLICAEDGEILAIVPIPRANVTEIIEALRDFAEDAEH